MTAATAPHAPVSEPVAAAEAAALADDRVGGGRRDGEVVGLAVEKLLESFSHCSLLPG